MSERDLLRVLMEDAELTPYRHGGGRLAITRDDNRELIADFYGNGEWREFFMELIRAESKRRSAQETVPAPELSTPDDRWDDSQDLTDRDRE